MRGPGRGGGEGEGEEGGWGLCETHVNVYFKQIFSLVYSSCWCCILGSALATPEKFENAALFVVRPTVHTNPAQTRNHFPSCSVGSPQFFENGFFKPEFQNAGFPFECGRKTD